MTVDSDEMMKLSRLYTNSNRCDCDALVVVVVVVVVMNDIIDPLIGLSDIPNLNPATYKIFKVDFKYIF
jgi:hypothetical protein